MHMIMECNVELNHTFKKEKKMYKGSSPELSNMPSGVTKLTSLDLNPTQPQSWQHVPRVPTLHEYRDFSW